MNLPLTVHISDLESTEWPLFCDVDSVLTWSQALLDLVLTETRPPFTVDLPDLDSSLTQLALQIF